MDIMIEKAKEELEMLETNHPDRFAYLKNELKSFITLLRSQYVPESLPPTTSATTQASTSMKRKRVCNEKDGGWESDEKCEIDNGKIVTLKKDRVDVVLDKAQACLRKIKRFKFSLIC